MPRAWRSFAFEAGPERWSPDNPRLYRVEIANGRGRRVADEIGFRTVEVRGREILLNGEPIFLRGVSIHEEAGHGEGRVHSTVQAQRVLGWARDLELQLRAPLPLPHNDG